MLGVVVVVVSVLDDGAAEGDSDGDDDRQDFGDADDGDGERDVDYDVDRCDHDAADGDDDEHLCYGGAHLLDSQPIALRQHEIHVQHRWSEYHYHDWNDRDLNGRGDGMLWDVDVDVQYHLCYYL